MFPPCSATMRAEMASPSPFPSRLVVKNGLKRLGRTCSGMPGPGVLDVHGDPPLGEPGADREPAAGRAHGLAGVQADVQEDLLELVGIGEHVGDLAQVGLDVDGGQPSLLPDEEEHLLQRGVEVGVAQAGLGRAGEGEQALHGVGEPRHLVAHLPHDVGLAGVPAQVLGEELERPGEARRAGS